MTIPLTLAFIVNDTHVLLGLKKRGFGVGKWNGFGGKVEKDESIEDAARRELYEEAGVDARGLRELGVLHFTWKETPAFSDELEVHVFSASKFEGEVQETEEMRPQWFNYGDIPFDNMWKDNAFWFPILLQGKSFRGSFVLDSQNEILEHELFEI